MKILSYREYKLRQAAISRQHDANLRMYQMFIHNENMMKRLAKQQDLRDRGRMSFMGRAKTAVQNIISRRRESNGSQRNPERGRPLHRGIPQGRTTRRGGETQVAGVNQHHVLGKSRRGSSRQSG